MRFLRSDYNTEMFLILCQFAQYGQNLTEGGLLSFGFAIKAASILVMKNRPVFIIFEQMKKATAPGASALKAESWPQPEL